MDYIPINLQKKLAKFSDHWSPKIIAQMNDYHFKLVKLKGDFVWQSHDDTDEIFITLDGEMSIEFRDGKVDLKVGEMFVEHEKQGMRVHLFIRKSRDIQGVTRDFTYLGEGDYLESHGDKPMYIKWKLQNKVPDKIFLDLTS